MTLPEAIACLACLALIGFGAIWAFCCRWPGESRHSYGNGYLPADHDFIANANRPGDAETSRGGSVQGG